MDEFRPKLALSMRQNGYVPTDAIFVVKHEPSGKYLVKEGNRRVTVLQNLLEEDVKDKSYECSPELANRLKRLKFSKFVLLKGTKIA